MAITPPPTPPNTGDPAFLEQRADAFFGWFPTFVSQFNAELPFISSKGWATYSGTANAIVLTAGYVSLLRGTQVRFRATAANTGAATINLDGLGARQCRTITGAPLPSGYILTDADTVATYDGTYWVLDRQTERGINANGEYVRFGDGTQVCTHVLTNLPDPAAAWGSLYISTETVWNFPSSFLGAPYADASVRFGGGIFAKCRPNGATSASVSLISGQSLPNTRVADTIAIGRWF
ncbi:hypothetical protein [Paracoccus sp. SY]|uniref:hypothetical protein n=1 Tax=Paracoccus sp. SY TaxID=1330255 RepID=UPI0011AEEB68|nr:hypothetical protein [Paracoccus sp. SY]